VASLGALPDFWQPHQKGCTYEDRSMKLAFFQKGDNWGAMPFYFNLTHPVGKGYPNAAADDVAFVQFAFAAIATNTNAPAPANLVTAWSKVQVSGVMDGATQAGIDAWQLDRRQRFGNLFEADGIFSVSPPNTSYAKDTPYAIVGINWILINATPSIWPRLDMHRLATPVLKEAVRKAISETLTA
jgi:hypothetical protein